MNEFAERGAPDADVDVVVVGAGQAGLSSAYHLARAGIGHVVLDHAPRPGGAWQFRWPSLTYGKVHGMHALPGMELTGADPLRPSSEVIAEYFAAYEDRFDLRVHRPVDVSAVRDGADGRLLVESRVGTWSTRALINATGTWDRPFWPRYPGQELFRGRQLHTANYPGPGGFAGARVVVVGGGTSAVQHLLEIAEVAAETTWVTRRPPVFRDGSFGEAEGRAAVALVEDRVRQGLPPRSVVSVTGLPLNEAVRAGLASGVLARRPVFDRLTRTGAAWADGSRVDVDVILWATGFRAAIDHLASLRLREPGAASASRAPVRSATSGSTWSATVLRRRPSAPTAPAAPRSVRSTGCSPGPRPTSAEERRPRLGAQVFREAVLRRLNSATWRLCSSYVAEKRVSPCFTVTKKSQSPGVGATAAAMARRPGLSIGVGGRPWRSYVLKGLSIFVSLSLVSTVERFSA